MAQKAEQGDHPAMSSNLAGYPDERLYRNLRSGDGEEAVRCLLPRIKRFVCHRCPDLSRDAEEIAVVVMERIYERLETFDATKRFSTWCFGVAQNVIWEWLRERKKQPVQYDPDEGQEAEDGNPEDHVLDEVSREINLLVIEEALATLTDLQREVYIYRHTTAFTSAEIGEKIGRSAGAVRSAQADAHAAVQRWRKERGYA